MNCPTKNTETTGKVGYNQNPSVFNNELTTNRSFDGESGERKSEEDELGRDEGNRKAIKIVSESGANMNSNVGEWTGSRGNTIPPSTATSTATSIATSTATSTATNPVSTTPPFSTSTSTPTFIAPRSRPFNPERILIPLKKELGPNPEIPNNGRLLIPPSSPSTVVQEASTDEERNKISSTKKSGIVKKRVRFDSTPPEEFDHSLDEDVDDSNYQYTTNIPLLQQIDILKGLHKENDSDNDRTIDLKLDMSPTTQSDITLSNPERRRKGSFVKVDYGTNSSAFTPAYSQSDSDDDEGGNGGSNSNDSNNISSSSNSNINNNISNNQNEDYDYSNHYHPSNTFTSSPGSSILNSSSMSFKEKIDYIITHSRKVATKYARFIGPGIMVSVAYLDPGNYSTAVTAGAMYQYKHLFVILLSNIFAVFLQILCVKLGSVTGLDLAQNCREHLPRWLCIVVYILAEIAIIATDLAEVVGTAIALNILVGIPLPVGVVLTVLDVLLVLLAYRPNGPVKFIRYFEYMVSGLVFVVVVCFAVELMSIGPIGFGTVMRGFLPSVELIESQGLYMSCGILGATVMPHSLYLGSGLVQPRLREFDTKHGYFVEESETDMNAGADSDTTDDLIPSSSASNFSTDSGLKYRPSVHAIKYAMNFSIAELVMSLFTVAIFVNSAILIVAAATLSHSPEALDADLFSIYDMLWKYLGHLAAIVFALALLFSGQSAGIVCTLAGQMVSEGFLHWSFQPWIRRLITRAIAIAPCLFVAMFVGRKGLADVLNASQVVLSLLLPFVSAPLLYFTRSKKIMSVRVTESSLSSTSGAANINNVINDSGYLRVDTDESAVGQNTPSVAYIDMSNSKLTNFIAVFIFAFVSSLNIFLIMSMALGADVKM